jgi:hypothetical protein
VPSLTDKIVTQLTAKLDSNVVRVIFEKPTAKNYKHFKQVCCDFVVELQSLSDDSIDNPWKDAHANVVQRPVAKGSSNWLQFDEKMSPVQAQSHVLSQNGFRVGARVVNVKSNEVATIESIGDDGSLSLKFNSTTVRMLYDLFLDGFVLAKEGSQTLDWTSLASSSKAETQMQKHLVGCCLLACLQQNNLQPSDLAIRKPKGAFALKAFKKAKCILAPYTTKIVSSDADSGSANLLRISNSSLWLVPDRVPVKDESVFIPAWHVQPTSEEAAANMAWKRDRISVSASRKNSSILDSHVDVPYLINISEIHAGDELRFFQAAPSVEDNAPKHKREVVLATTTSPKKAKKEKGHRISS